MSFGTFESSRQSGGPIQLFLYRYGTGVGEYYAYTDHTEGVTVDHGGSLGVIDYLPVPLKRESIVTNGTLDRAALGLHMDVSTDLSELFRVYPPANVVTLTIFAGHVDDPDGEFVAIWTGRLMSAGREHSELALSAEPISTQMKRPGLRRNWQYGCPHWLYGPQCKASKVVATVSATVASVSGNVVTLEAGWEGALPPDKFVRGIFEWTPAGESTRQRMIVRRSGNVLTLAGIATSLAAADGVNVVLGCNHKAYADAGGDCQGLHDNILNYGGQPRIPIKNVVNSNPYY